jgi:hypothetical protein
MVALGCGRLGFSNAGAGPGGDDDDDDDGVPCSVTSVAVSEGAMRATSPMMVWNGTRFGVSWLEDTTPQSAHFRTLSIDGAMDPIANLGAAGEEVQVAWDGTSWRLVWANTATNPAIMLSTNGDAARALTSNTRSNREPRIAALSGGATAYLWVTDATTSNVRLTIIDAAGIKRVDDRAIATADGSQQHSLVWTGSELAAFYTVGPKLTMLRMNPDGNPVAAATTVVTVPDLSSPYSDFDNALVAWAGDRFLLAWMASGELQLTYATRDGMQQFPPVTVGTYGGFSFLGPTLAVGADWDAIIYDTLLGNTTYLVEVYRDGSLGKPYAFDKASWPAAVWVNNAWAVAVSQVQPGAKPNYIKLVQLCR